MFESASRLILIAIISLTISFGCIEKQNAQGESPIHIKDPELEEYIRDKLDKPEGELYPSDLTELTNLRIGDYDTTGWSWLEHCTSVTHAEIRITDNHNLSPLAKLPNLEELFVAPACLKWEYQGSSSQCVELANVSNIIFPSEFPNLKLLYLFCVNISDPSSLSGLSDLETLYVSNHGTLDLSTFPDLKNLTKLEIWNSGVTGLEGIIKLQNLEKLSLYDWERGHPPLDITPLAHMINLTQLHLPEYKISDISPLSNLTQLTELALRQNHITDISPLADLTQLTHLYLQENDIDDISPLANLTKLEWLDLSSNNITDILSLSWMKNLVLLRLSDNRITNVAPVSNFANLHCLELDNNAIIDISPLVSNAGIGREAEEIVMEHGRGYSDWETRRSDTINVCGNPLNEDSTGIHIPQLKARGALILCGH